MPVSTPPKRRSSDPPQRPPRPPRTTGRVARERHPGRWSLVMLALLCAALAGWIAMRSRQPLLWDALVAGLVIYAAAIGYWATRNR